MSIEHDTWYAYVDLTHRYAEAVDARDGGTVAQLFCADGSFDGAAFGLPLIVGHAALQQHFEGGDPEVRSVHLVLNHRIVEMSGSRVVARSLGHAILSQPDRTRHLIVGYDDTLEAGERWMFRERVLRRELRF